MPTGGNGDNHQGGEDDEDDDIHSSCSKQSKTASELRAIIASELTNILGKNNTPPVLTFNLF